VSLATGMRRECFDFGPLISPSGLERCTLQTENGATRWLFQTRTNAKVTLRPCGRVRYWVVGAADGIPVLTLHSGPGAGHHLACAR
jgi:hypothetical protein